MSKTSSINKWPHDSRPSTEKRNTKSSGNEHIHSCSCRIIQNYSHDHFLVSRIQVQIGGRLLQSGHWSRWKGKGFGQFARFPVRALKRFSSSSSPDHSGGAAQEDPLSGVHSARHQRSNGQERASRVFVAQSDRQRSSLLPKGLAQLSSDASQGVQQSSDNVPARIKRLPYGFPSIRTRLESVRRQCAVLRSKINLPPLSFSIHNRLKLSVCSRNERALCARLFAFI